MRIGWKHIGALRWMQSTVAVEAVAFCEYGDDFEGYKVGSISIFNTSSQVWLGNGAVSQNYTATVASDDFETDPLGSASSIASGTGWIGNGTIRTNS